MAREKLDPNRITTALQERPGWSLVRDGEAIERKYVFANFSEAFAFMTRSALAAEKLDHHPEWFNVYRKVDVVLTTHSSGGVTELDLELARLMDEAAGPNGNH